MNNTIRLVLLFQLSLTYGLTLSIPAQAQAQGPALGSHLRVPPYGPTLGSYHLRVQPKNPGSRVPPYVSGSHFSAMSGLQVCNFIKKRFQHRCFPVKFAKFLRTPFFTEYLRWLLLMFLSSVESECPTAARVFKCPLSAQMSNECSSSKKGL